MNMESLRWAFNSRLWTPKREELVLALSLIQKEEKERIMKFVFQRDAKASLIGRLIMRKAVSESLNVAWSDLILGRSERGRPFLLSPNFKNFQKFDFNISHQGDLVVLATEENCSHVGIDVMKIEKASKKDVPEFFRLMNRQFTANEWSYILKNSEEQKQLKAFYRNWCLKEALVKSLGVGINYNLLSLSFMVNSDIGNETITDTTVNIEGSKDAMWSFEEVLLDPEHIVTVASYCQENGASNNIPAFRWLTFNELVQSGQKIQALDEITAEEFLLKAERA